MSKMNKLNICSIPKNKYPKNTIFVIERTPEQAFYHSYSKSNPIIHKKKKIEYEKTPQSSSSTLIPIRSPSDMKLHPNRSKSIPNVRSVNIHHVTLVPSATMYQPSMLQKKRSYFNGVQTPYSLGKRKTKYRSSHSCHSLKYRKPHQRQFRYPPKCESDYSISDYSSTICTSSFPSFPSLAFIPVSYHPPFTDEPLSDSFSIPSLFKNKHQSIKGKHKIYQISDKKNISQSTIDAFADKMRMTESECTTESNDENISLIGKSFSMNHSPFSLTPYEDDTHTKHRRAPVKRRKYSNSSSSEYKQSLVLPSLDILWKRKKLIKYKKNGNGGHSIPVSYSSSSSSASSLSDSMNTKYPQKRKKSSISSAQTTINNTVNHTINHTINVQNNVYNIHRHRNESESENVPAFHNMSSGSLDLYPINTVLVSPTAESRSLMLSANRRNFISPMMLGGNGGKLSAVEQLYDDTDDDYDENETLM